VSAGLSGQREAPAAEPLGAWRREASGPWPTRDEDPPVKRFVQSGRTSFFPVPIRNSTTGRTVTVLASFRSNELPLHRNLTSD